MPLCGQIYALTPEQAPQYAGQTITCTNCKRPFVAQVPGYSPAGAAVPPPPVAGIVPPVPPVPPGSVPYATPSTGPAQQSNGLAIGGLVTGILGFCVPLLGIVAIILSAMGLRRTRDPRVGGKGLAIAGLVLGIIGTLFSVLQLAIMLPALDSAREQARRVKCASNLRQLGLAIQMYANDNQGVFPPDLGTVYRSQSLTSEVLVCPSGNDTAAPGTPSFTLGQDLSYVYVGQKQTFASLADTITAYEQPANHRNQGGNVLYADGHVEFRRDLPALVAEINAGHNPPRPPGKGR